MSDSGGYCSTNIAVGTCLIFSILYITYLSTCLGTSKTVQVMLGLSPASSMSTTIKAAAAAYDCCYSLTQQDAMLIFGAHASNQNIQTPSKIPFIHLHPRDLGTLNHLNMHIWLVVSTPLKNIIRTNKTNVPNHQPDTNILHSHHFRSPATTGQGSTCSCSGAKRRSKTTKPCVFS